MGIDIGVPKDSAVGKRRVAVTPGVVPKLPGGGGNGTDGGLEVLVERRAGARLPSRQLEQAGGRLIENTAGVYGAGAVVEVAMPTAGEIGRLGPDEVLIGFLQPLAGGGAIRAIAASGVMSFAVEAIPPISRTQSIRSATVPVLGAGVAGLKAIATARRRGAGDNSKLPEPRQSVIQSPLGLMISDEGQLAPFDDEVIASACITADDEIVHEAARAASESLEPTIPS